MEYDIENENLLDSSDYQIVGKKFSRKYLIGILVVLLSNISTSIVSITIWPYLYLNKQSLIILGLSISTFHLGSTLGREFFNRYLENKKSYWFLLFTFIAITLIGDIIYAAFPQSFLIVLSRFIVGFGSSSQVILHSLLADSKDSILHRYRISKVSLFTSLSYIIGPVIVAAFSKLQIKAHFNIIASADIDGVNLLSWIAAFLTFFSIIVTAIGKLLDNSISQYYESEIYDAYQLPKPKQKPYRTQKSCIFPTEITLFLFVSVNFFVYSVGMIVETIFIPLMFDKSGYGPYNWDLTKISLFFMCLGISTCLSSTLSKRISNNRVLLYVSLVLTAIGFLFLIDWTHSSNPEIFRFCFGIMFIALSFPILIISIYNIFSELFENIYITYTHKFYHFSTILGKFISPILSTIIFLKIGHNIIFIFVSYLNRMSNTDIDIDNLLEESFNSFRKDISEDKKRTIDQIDQSQEVDDAQQPSDMKKRRSKSPPRDKDYRDRDYRDGYRDRDYYSRDRERDYRDRDYYGRDSRDRDYYGRDRDREYRDRDYDSGYSRSSRGYYSRSGYDRYDRERGDRYERDPKKPEPTQTASTSNVSTTPTTSTTTPSTVSPQGASKSIKEKPTSSVSGSTPPTAETIKEPDEESDQRTVFISNLSPNIAKQDLFEFFAPAGKVIDVSLIIDRVTNKPKGVGYVEFENVQQVQSAVQMSGKMVMGQPIAVHTIQPEKKATKSSTGNARIYVGFIHLNANEDQIRNIFLPYGEIEFINIHTKPGSKYAFVQFRNSENAKKAIQELNGSEFMGKNLKLNMVSEEKNSNGTYVQLPQPGKPLQTGPHTIQINNYHQHGNSFKDNNPLSSLDEDDGGIPLTAHGRALLTAKLQGKVLPGTATQITQQYQQHHNQHQMQPPQQQQPAIVNTFKSTCMLLKNMFDPEFETEENWDKEILNDTKEECMSFGKVEHIHLDKNTKGYIYVRFDNTDSPIAAINKLHGRWFSQRTISAELVPEPIYKLQFPW
ncbi:putative RNA splicing factor [Tieghemostelium lacteum]|uniref:Putative RNA splicing factor n=1 Tax=Tieghemostelium lacteum TaxID=361077 RepID=A0A151Z3D6_TIELA|nr:putative RNA splicing factor [Tieghemostelium lacteum]|eukprot:KYQ88461.1 putative RNA splicing factor [Tieghemostelium lacteum]